MTLIIRINNCALCISVLHNPAKAILILASCFQNIMAPKVGAANTPYARTVRPQTLRPNALPDAGDLFDQLMIRDEFKPHPSGLSSMLFYLGSIIIHGMTMWKEHVEAAANP